MTENRKVTGSTPVGATTEKSPAGRGTSYFSAPYSSASGNASQELESGHAGENFHVKDFKMGGLV